MAEIVLPETKPATEWVRGRPLQKVSPQREHALAQSVFVSALFAWAKRHRSGRVGTEWEFRLEPPGEMRRPLVPDVAYLSYARIPRECESDADIPRIAPDVAVEILSPGDAVADVEEKVRVYLAAGTEVVILVDTRRRTATARRADGQRLFSEPERIRDPALPGFAMQVGALFKEP
ncbi:MAG: Uma2 family endonuclease [Candidatus Eremiobacteraeota bacterium]|nr:Uma2 family endonuclease [Candidatus Eremiobacteraeota bacterium]MBV8222206.1 Uma2 family endonuclease [Candidatus Eremiobacteraeota bacterium]